MDMATQIFREADQGVFGDNVSGISPAGLEQFKLERLLELRAVIDAMRAEHTLDLLSDAGRRDRRPGR
jgi:hypothetical protein